MKIEFDYKGHRIKIDCGLYVNERFVNYETVLKKLHPHITWYYDESGSYQGEWFAVGYDSNYNWYYHKGTYGSCSSCDWLDSIRTKEDAIEFLKAMEQIIPIGDKNHAIQYLNNEKQNLWNDANNVIDKLIQKVETNDRTKQ